MMLEAVDHVGHAVRDLEAAIGHHERLYGARVAHRETMEHDGVREALIAVGDSYIQLLEPTRPDSPVARFLERRGEGLHHVAYRVPDVAAALSELKSRGARLVDERPRRGSRGTTIAFVHPASAMGVLVELVEEPAEGVPTAPERPGG